MDEQDRIDLDPDPIVPSRQLSAMRWVITHMQDQNEMQRSMRKFKDAKPTEFNRLLAQLEKEYRVGLRAAEVAAKETGSNDGVSDVGTEKCLVLVDEWLKDRSWEK